MQFVYACLAQLAYAYGTCLVLSLLLIVWCCVQLAVDYARYGERTKPAVRMRTH